ncbi:hypothetical protein [Paremcibacter congregatus]|uniref:hypothetical protein n=1 Tax=Paremcibacter congregatus TaxID=2043170 RepID=UPI0030ED30BC|tara:strand:+ start:33009 stop:34490 length:1482 start_codon:yes stop_codon:yes gene_type:complete
MKHIPFKAVSPLSSFAKGSFFVATIALSLGQITPALAANAACQETLTCKTSWTDISAPKKQQVFRFADDYKKFIAKAVTELTYVDEARRFAKAKGFKKLTDKSPMTPGARYYDVNRDRAITFLVIGEDALTTGLHVIGAHIDSPRLELKGRPLDSSGDFALFQTNFHGGIKNYQWTNIPLALVGRVDKKDGTTVKINVGLNPEDPVFMIPDLSPHTDRGYGNKKVADIIKKEDLDPVVGHIPDGSGSDAIKQGVFNHLKATYGITPADLVSAELSLVPASPPRDLGFDRGLIAAYGQDDKLASYAAMRAIADLKTPQKTALAYLVDNEEVGNRNNTGAKSEYFPTLVARLLSSTLGTDYRDTSLRQTLRQSKMVSVDVNPGINPKNPGAWEKGNAPRLGYGVNIKLYGQGNTANSEYVAWTRNYLDQAGVPWQTTTYKVGAAGGGTIGGEFSRQDMEVIDFGVPLLSIHTPMAISSKIDIFHLYQASVAFFNK